MELQYNPGTEFFFHFILSKHSKMTTLFSATESWHIQQHTQFKYYYLYYLILSIYFYSFFVFIYFCLEFGVQVQGPGSRVQSMFYTMPMGRVIPELAPKAV